MYVNAKDISLAIRTSSKNNARIDALLGIIDFADKGLTPR